MDILQEISKKYFRTDLPELQIGDKVEVTIKNLNQKEKDKDGKNKYRLTHFKGIVIAQNNSGQVSYTFSVLKESSKVAIVSAFSYHSPLIVSIKKLGRINQEVHQAKLNYLVRELAEKKDNE